MTHTLSDDRIIKAWDGSRIPARRLDPRRLLAHDTAHKLVDQARAVQELLLDEKLKFYADVDAYIDLVLESYGARLGGTRGGLRIEAIDGVRKVEVSVMDYQSVTAAIEAARVLMNEILDDLVGDASDDLRAIVGNAFARNSKTGKISTERVLSLRQLNLSHPKWPLAKDAISDAVTTAGSRRYIRFYERDRPDVSWKQIDLNFSSLGDR
ncbi:DUF3164 family protein [Gluconobacter albidus]|uniref:DUF3164 family protein n=1 Tax=Gluconobacter albidus TaxID=318683 RepID=UPI000780C3CF|nr:DUF3164 family protein [Gluconobacter albidus]